MTLATLGEAMVLPVPDTFTLVTALSPPEAQRASKPAFVILPVRICRHAVAGNLVGGVVYSFQMEENYLTEFDLILRLVLSFFAGGVLGFQRASKHQTAGLKTHILICLGATLLMLLSIWIPQTFMGLKNGDPGRIAAQVVSGIGFLGAGAMIRLGNNIKGLTTAASLWFVAALGLAVGAGMFLAAAVALLISVFTLTVVDVIEQRVFPAERNKVLIVRYKSANDSTDRTIEILRVFRIRVISVDVDDSDTNSGLKMKILAGIPVKVNTSKLTAAIKASGNVDTIEVKENY
jgi:putative Mg2+ transporter-C (MgtC) family protein